MSTLSHNEWVKKFYKGNLVAKGWHARQKEVLTLANDHHDDIRIYMTRLGQMIAQEWAKENSIRKIDNNDLIAWGERMKKAARQSGSSILTELASIENEVVQKLKA